MNIVATPLILMLAGGLLYFAPAGKFCELGRIAFFVGLFWLFKR